MTRLPWAAHTYFIFKIYRRHYYVSLEFILTVNECIQSGASVRCKRETISDVISKK